MATLVRRCAVFALLLFSAEVAVVQAQERATVRVLAASTKKSTEATAPLLGAGVGVDVGDFLEVIVEGAVDRPREYPPHRPPAQPFTTPSLPIRFVSGFELEDRIDRYFSGGIRLLAPTEHVRPFGELTLGWAREQSVIQWNDEGPLTSTSSTGFATVGGGIEFRLASRVELGAGYRYGHQRDAFDGFHTVHAALGFAFR